MLNLDLWKLLLDLKSIASDILRYIFEPAEWIRYIAIYFNLPSEYDTWPADKPPIYLQKSFISNLDPHLDSSACVFNQDCSKSKLLTVECCGCWDKIIISNSYFWISLLCFANQRFENTSDPPERRLRLKMVIIVVLCTHQSPPSPTYLHRHLLQCHRCRGPSLPPSWKMRR